MNDPSGLFGPNLFDRVFNDGNDEIIEEIVSMTHIWPNDSLFYSKDQVTQLQCYSFKCLQFPVPPIINILPTPASMSSVFLIKSSRKSIGNESLPY